MKIDIAPELSIDDRELEISFIQAGGPGGQNLNEVATAAHLRLDAHRHRPTGEARKYFFLEKRNKKPLLA